MACVCMCVYYRSAHDVYILTNKRSHCEMRFMCVCRDTETFSFIVNE